MSPFRTVQSLNFYLFITLFLFWCSKVFFGKRTFERFTWCQYIVFCWSSLLIISSFSWACFQTQYLYFFSVYFSIFVNFLLFFSLLLKVEMYFFISTLQRQHRAFELFRWLFEGCLMRNQLFLKIIDFFFFFCLPFQAVGSWTWSSNI